MKAVRVHEFGGPEQLRLEEVPVPEPGRGQARVKLEAAGLNFIDIYQRRGLYPLPLPATLGMEGAGTVEVVAPGVEEVQPGQRVAFAMEGGAYAERAVVTAERLVPLPEGVSPQQAAAVMLQGMTAHYLSHSTFPLQPGQTALVHAAAGGVGLLLVQLAKLRGARVLGTVSSEEKAALARQVGADEVIRYDEQDFEAEVRRLTDGAGVAVVYDSVGAATFAKSLNCLRPRGTLVLFGQASGPVAPFDPQVLNAKGSLYLTRPSLAHYAAERAELVERASYLFDGLSRGELSVRVDRTFPLAEVARAHQHMEARRTKGKVLLLPA